jgi:hypothetical protein
LPCGGKAERRQKAGGWFGNGGGASLRKLASPRCAETVYGDTVVGQRSGNHRDGEADGQRLVYHQTKQQILHKDVRDRRTKDKLRDTEIIIVGDFRLAEIDEQESEASGLVPIRRSKNPGSPDVVVTSKAFAKLSIPVTPGMKMSAEMSVTRLPTRRLTGL